MVIKVKDLMLKAPFSLYVYDTVGIAKNLLRKTDWKSFPVIFPDGRYAGILSENSIIHSSIPENDQIFDYLEFTDLGVQEDDLLSIVTQLAIEESPILAVLDKMNCLVGILPRPKFLVNTFNDIVKSIKHVLGSKFTDIEEHGIIVIDDEGKIIYFNDNAEKFMGYKARDVFAFHVNKIIHSSRLMEVVRKGKPLLGYELNDGRVNLLTNRFPLLHGGQVVGAIGIFNDLREKEELKEDIRTLRKTNIKLINILETMDDGIMLVDNRRLGVRVNTAFEEITGVSASSWINEDVYEIFASHALPNLFREEIVEKQKTTSFIEFIKDKEYLVTCSPVYYDDIKRPYFIATVQDINKVNEIVTSLQATKDLANSYYTEVEKRYVQLNYDDMIASSGAMKRVMNLALRVAQVDSTVLIMGETGVGKEVLARAIHKCSHRMAGSFIKLNCGAIPEALLESELFGYEAGAFTGAKKEGKPGLIELADGGTLFLDEIGDLPMNIQVKFLRVLQEREIQRVGGVKTKQVDFRLIAATNKNLENSVKEKKFREDLFYRLNVVPVTIPPLRERKEDIVPLVIAFLDKFNKKYGMSKKIAPEVIQNLLNYEWPGNVRELENTIERLTVTSESNLVKVHNLKDIMNITQISAKSSMDLKDVLEQTEKNLILRAFQQCRTTREMADMLGISQSAVVKKMQKHDIKENSNTINELC